MGAVHSATFFGKKTFRQFYISQNVYSATFYSEIVKKQRTIRKRTKLAKSPFRYSPFEKINLWQNLIKKQFGKNNISLDEYLTEFGHYNL